METALIEAIHAINYLIEENRKLQSKNAELTLTLEAARRASGGGLSYLAVPTAGGAANV